VTRVATAAASPAPSALVLRHLDLVRQIAAQMARRIPKSVDEDDLIQTGMVGLLEAAQRYECRNTSSFTTYATPRIRGAMLDSLRRCDWGPRSLRRQLRNIDDAKHCIESKTGAAAKAPAIAAYVGMTLDCYFRALQADNQAMQTSVEATAAPGVEGECARCTDGKLGPPEELEHAEIARAIAAAIGTLPEQERAILALYYGRELLMREIGIRFAVSESRICQIHKRGIEHVRAALQILTPRGYVRYRSRNSRASC
jgi:RNA polymerase sigma factor FliA